MRLTKSVAAFSALLLTALPLAFSSQAQAAPNPDSLSVYLDAPLVQGSYVAAAGASGTEFTNFNNTVGVGNCAQGLPSSLTLTGTCRIDAVNAYGGATATADVATATVGGGWFSLCNHR